MSGSTPAPPPDPPARPSPGSSLSSAFRAVHQFDLAQLGLGVLIFIASLLPFYSYTAKIEGAGALGLTGDTTAHLNAWHGFFGWFGVLLAIAAAGVLAARLLANAAIPSVRTTVLALFGGSAVCLLIALLVMPGGGQDGLLVPGLSIDSGHSFGYWLALLCSLAATALAYLRLQART